MIWICQCTFNAPSSCQAGIEGRSSQAKSIRPVLKNHSSPIVGNDDIASVVATLFLPGGPRAIFGAIISIIVNAVNGVLWRGTSAHVGQKLRKPIGAQPSFTDLYAATPIVFICVIVGIITTLSHRTPDGKLRQLRLAVRCVSLPGFVSPQTAAAFSVSATKATGDHRYFVSARTLTSAIRSPAPARRSQDRFCYDKPSKGLAAKVGHNVILLGRGVAFLCDTYIIVPSFGGIRNA